LREIGLREKVRAAFESENGYGLLAVGLVVG